jgi:hypothetical protein
MASKKKASDSVAAFDVPPARAVDPKRFTNAEILSLDSAVNSLEIDYLALIENIRNWTAIDATPAGVLDQMSVYLIDSFQTLLKGYTNANITVSDITKIKDMLGVKLRPALDKMLIMKDAEDNAKYTLFCSTFLGEMSGIEARGILEVLNPDPQCEATVDAKKVCWICGNPLRWETVEEEAKPQCEHILPISDALFHLNLYQNRSSISTLGKYDVEILKLEYLWAHACCNLSKQNLRYIATDVNGKYIVNDDGINTTIDRIKKNYGTFDCQAIFQSKGGPKYAKLTLERITKYIEPIVETINNHIEYIASIGTGINKQKGYIVYEYLIMVRFFSRIPANTLVKAFKKFYLEGDVEYEAEQQRLLEEKIKQEQANAEERASIKAAKELAAKAKQDALLKKQEDARAAAAAKKAAAGTPESRLAARLARIQEQQEKDAAKRAEKEAAKKALLAMTEQIEDMVDHIHTGIISTANDDSVLLEHITTVDDIIPPTTGGASPYIPQKSWNRISSAAIKKIPDVIQRQQHERNERARRRGHQPSERNNRAFRRHQISLHSSEARTRSRDGERNKRIIDSWVNTGLQANKELADPIFSDLDLQNIHRLSALRELEKYHQESDNGDARALEARLEELRKIEQRHGSKYPDDSDASHGHNLRKRGGENKDDDPYAIIQNDFTTEKAFVFLLAYQPIYLRLRGLHSVTADQYMSTPHILRDTLTYFGVDPAEYRTLLTNHLPRVAVSTTQPKRRIVPTQSPQNIAKLMAALGRRPQTQYHANIPRDSPYRSIIGRGGKRLTKKRRVVKRRTRKHKKN